MIARELGPEQYGKTVEIEVQTIPMHPGAVGHKHSQVLVLEKVEHRDDGTVRTWEVGNPYYSTFAGDAAVVVDGGEI